MEMLWEGMDRSITYPDFYDFTENPKSIKYNTNLGSIECTASKATLNNSEEFLYNIEPKKGDKLLTYNHKTNTWKITTCIANQSGFPIITDDNSVMIDFTDELIGIKRD